MAEEIEKGLAAIREGAEVTAETMIRQLDADRVFAIRTENASAATRASELKAKLVGLMIDRRVTRSAHIVKAEDYKTKDVALALAALCQDSDLTFVRNGDALAGEAVAALTRASGTPAVVPDASFSPELPDPDSPSEKIGTQIPVGNRGATIVPLITEGGERKYAVYDAFDELHGFRFKRSDAEDHAARLPGPSKQQKRQNI